MELPLSLSAAQKRNLKKGGAITIKPDMVSDAAKYALIMLPASAKKILGVLSKNKGVRYAIKQGEDVIDRMTGKGLFDIAKSIGKVVAPIAIDLASKEAKKRISGSGSPYLSRPYKQSMKYIKAGGSVFPAGGSIYPAGKYGSGLEDSPIQLGSPYINTNSPAMNPFIETKSIQSYDPIQKKKR
jgi:hypothetical protein